MPALIPLGATAVVMPAARDRDLALAVGALGGSLAMAGVAVSSIAIWRYLSGTPLRWFLAGAGIWAAGVALKFLFAAALYEPGLAAMRSALPSWAYLTLGSLHGGLFTGVFEIGGTLAAGLIWRSLAREARRAVAVGIGAGALEALLLALPLLATGVAGLPGMPDRAMVLDALAETSANTWTDWLVPPAERLLALLGHTGSRVLVLLTVATGRWRWFWYGFLMLTVGDGVATYFDLSGQLETISIWWVELALSPIAIISVPIIIWCVRGWPAHPVTRAAEEVAVARRGPEEPPAPAAAETAREQAGSRMASRVFASPMFAIGLVIATGMACGCLAPADLVDSLLSIALILAAVGLLSTLVLLVVPGWRRRATAFAKATGLLALFFLVTLIGYSPRLPQ